MKEYTGINIQFPISELILSGEKSIETRTYPLPNKYLGKELAFIETPGAKGKFKARVVAIIKFTECFKYRTKKEFYNDIDKHCVSKDSPWAWKDKDKWGWKVIIVRRLKKPVSCKSQGIVFRKGIKL